MTDMSISASRDARTQPSQVNEPDLLSRSAELRDEVGSTRTAVENLHDSIQQSELDKNAYVFESSFDTPLLLETLSEVHNFPWAILAQVVGVTPTAVRKWRRGESVTPARHQALAELASFAQLLQRVDPRVDDVAYWLETPVASDTSLTRLDVYRAGHRVELLNIAAGRLGAHEALDRVVPQWRERFSRDSRFVTVFHDDGTPTIVMRSEDTTRESR